MKMMIPLSVILAMCAIAGYIENVL